MSKLRKKIEDEDGDEGHISESWLIPYADILTLLLALFIVLFASSNIDKEKYEGVMQSLQYELMGNNSGAKVGEGDKSGIDSKNDEIQTDKEQEKPAEEAAEDTEPATIIDPELEELKKQLEKYLEENNLKTSITLQETKRGIEISLQEMVLFDSGSAVIKPESYETLNGLLGLIKNIENPISFEGHTDNVPIRSSSFPSNWELASARAASVLHYFEANNISAERMQFASYGEYKPIFENDTAEHRRINRRVTIVVMKKQ